MREAGHDDMQTLPRAVYDPSVSELDRLDPQRVPLPNGTKVTTRVDRESDGRRIPQGAVGQVVATVGEHIDVKLATGGVVRYRRTDLVPTKLGEVRYAVRRERAWQALRGCVVIETVVGSRAWGLAEEGSDTDVRGVFVLPFRWTIGLVEPPGELISVDGSETFWEAHKAMRQALRADPNTLETLFLPGARAVDEMGEWLLEGRQAFVSREIYGSFGRYALSQLDKLRHAKRLAEHRAIVVEWLRDDPKLSLDQTAKRLAHAIDAASEHDAVQRAKAYIKQLYGSLYDQGLLSARDFPALVAFAATQALEVELPRQLRPKNAYNLVRLIASATDWLATGEPHLEVSSALKPELLAIKRGEVPLDDVVALAESMMPALDRARAASPLPSRPDVAAADAILRRIREESARRFFSGESGRFGPAGPELPAAGEDP